MSQCSQVILSFCHGVFYQKTLPVFKLKLIHQLPLNTVSLSDHCCQHMNLFFLFKHFITGHHKRMGGCFNCCCGVFNQTPWLKSNMTYMYDEHVNLKKNAKNIKKKHKKIRRVYGIGVPYIFSDLKKKIKAELCIHF